MDGRSSMQEAQILFASGRPEESIHYFTVALEQGVDPVVVRLSRGTACMALRRHREAEDDFTMVLTADPENERALYFRGIARVALAEYAKAVEDLTRSLTKNHNRGIAYLARGLAYSELGNEKDAVLDFNSAAAFSSSEVASFLKLFEDHKSQLNRTMLMLKRESAPWKTLLTREEADKIRNWLTLSGNE